MSMLNELRPQDESRDLSLKGRIKELIPQKGDSKKEIFRKIVFIMAVCAFIWCVVDAIEFNSRSDLEATKNELSDLFHGVTTQPPENTQNPDTPENPDNTQNPDTPNNPDNQEQPSKYPSGMLSQFEPLYDLNQEIIGWLTIPGLEDANGELYIDYPVMQTTNNDFYIDHDFFKNEEKSGALFIDFRHKVTGVGTGAQNTVVYGHNMAAGTYFSHLNDYKKRPSFVSEHRIINYTTLYEEKEYIIFGCFLVGIYEEQDNLPLFKYHLAFDFEDISEFDYWYKNVLFRSYYITDIDCNMNDEYITLSTCSNELSDLRWVVVGRRVREGEDTSVYKYYSNPDARKPEVFYTFYNVTIPEGEPNYEYYQPQE